MPYYKGLKEARQIIKNRDKKLRVGQLPSQNQNIFAKFQASLDFNLRKQKKATAKQKMEMAKADGIIDAFLDEQNEVQFMPNHILKNDKIPVDKTLDNLQKQIDKAPSGYAKDQMIILIMPSRKSRDFSYGMDRLTQRPFGRFFGVHCIFDC